MLHDTSSLFAEDTLFVIVIYNCVITQSIAFQSLLNTDASLHAKDIFVYDNSVSAQEIPSINGIIHYYHNPFNAGVSAAYNKGFSKAKQLNKKWLLLLDQDTKLPTDALKKYIQNISIYSDKSIFVPTLMDGDQRVSPFKLRWGRGIKITSRQPGVHSFRHLCVINSGLLISSKLFESAGGYDERFPLDFSDLVFVERLSLLTSEFVLVDTLFLHSLSSQQDKHVPTSVLLSRFKKYCLAAKLAQKVSTKKVILSYIIFPRAFKLSLMKKDFRFLSTALYALIFNR